LNSHGHQLRDYPDGALLGRDWFAAGLPQPDGMERVYPIFQRLMRGKMEGVFARTATPSMMQPPRTR